MSFGFSIGDIVLLTQLVSSTIQNAIKACGAHNVLTREVSNLQVVLQRLRSEAERPTSILREEHDSRRLELAALITNCQRILGDLLIILEKYNALPEEERSFTKFWQRFKFGNGEMKDLGKIRIELCTHTAAINTYLSIILIESQGKVEQYMESHGDELRHIRSSLDRITASIQVQSRVVGSITYTDDDEEIWKQLRHELIREGYSSSVLKAHMSTIKDYVKELGDRGAMVPGTHGEHNISTYSDEICPIASGHHSHAAMSHSNSSSGSYICDSIATTSFEQDEMANVVFETVETPASLIADSQSQVCSNVPSFKFPDSSRYAESNLNIVYQISSVRKCLNDMSLSELKNELSVATKREIAARDVWEARVNENCGILVILPFSIKELKFIMSMPLEVRGDNFGDETARLLLHRKDATKRRTKQIKDRIKEVELERLPLHTMIVNSTQPQSRIALNLLDTPFPYSLYHFQSDILRSERLSTQLAMVSKENDVFQKSTAQLVAIAMPSIVRGTQAFMEFFEVYVERMKMEMRTETTSRPAMRLKLATKELYLQLHCAIPLNVLVEERLKFINGAKQELEAIKKATRLWIRNCIWMEKEGLVGWNEIGFTEWLCLLVKKSALEYALEQFEQKD